MKRLILLPFFLIILSGCSADYNTTLQSPQPLAAQQSLAQQTQTASVVAKSPAASTDNAVIVLPTDEGNGAAMYSDKYPVSYTIKGDSNITNQLATYGVSFDTWIAPRAWTGSGVIGADGNLSVDLYPASTGTSTSEHISYYEVPACLFCMLEEAAPYFSNALSQYNSTYNEDYSEDIVIPQGLEVTPISKNLITYTLPDRDGLSTRGVVYYNPDDASYGVALKEAKFVLPTTEADVTSFLIQNFITKENLNSYQQTNSTPPSSGLSNNNSYTNIDGNQVHSPAYSDTVPAGATAICSDGTYSFSQSRSGTCSHHGGVAEWY